MNPPLTDSSIARLPPECLEIVLHHLRFDLASLHRLLTVSRQFFQLTLPVLYRSPFRLVTRSVDQYDPIPDYPFTRYDPAWPRLVLRIESLTRLLIRNLQLGSPQQISQPLYHDDPDDRSAAEWGLQEYSGWSTLDVPPTIESQFGTGSWDDDEGPWQSHPGNDAAQHEEDSYPDLISFDDEADTFNLENSTAALSLIDNDDQALLSKAPQCGEESGGTGLFVDYFSFYTHQDHRMIESVIRQIFPDHNDYEYDVYLDTMNCAILRHNTKHIVSIDVHDFSTMIPILQDHLDQLERLQSIQIIDRFSERGLELVYQFLKDHTAKFSTCGDRTNHVGDEDPSSGVSTSTTAAMLRQGARRRASGIRHFKYSSNRTRWDQVRPEDQIVCPARLMEALGHGLESIYILRSPEHELEDLETLDVSSLRSLKVWFTEIPNNDATFSRPQFLSRCRQLESLEVYSNSSHMFSWAVIDWISNRRRDKVHTHPWVKDLATQSSLEHPARIRPLVRLRHLRIHSNMDGTAYDILRDALYGFRETLQEIEIHSIVDSMSDTPVWAEEPAIERRSIRNWDSTTPKAEIPAKGHLDKTTKLTEEMDDEECYNKCSSIGSKKLLIQWPVPFLTTLELRGSIAAALDMKSLQSMPRLHTLSLTIDLAPFMSSSPTCHDLSDSHRILHGVAALPYLSPKSLRRVLFAGPWPAISDETLQMMIKVIPSHTPVMTVDANSGRSKHKDDTDDDDVQDASWGMQLTELSVIGNRMVTVPGMIRLAQQMDRLEVMGTDLNLTIPIAEQPWSMAAAFPSDDVYERRPFYSQDGRQFTPDHDFAEVIAEKERGSDSRFGRAFRIRTMQQEAKARDMILRTRVEMPWIDLGPEANHLANRYRP